MYTRPDHRDILHLWISRSLKPVEDFAKSKFFFHFLREHIVIKDRENQDKKGRFCKKQGKQNKLYNFRKHEIYLVGYFVVVEYVVTKNIPSNYML